MSLPLPVASQIIVCVCRHCGSDKEASGSKEADPKEFDHQQDRFRR